MLKYNYKPNEKLNLKKYVTYNNYNKLEEHKSLIRSKFAVLLETSIVYHSKECFDIITDMTPQELKSIINNNNTVRKLDSMFINYNMAPNPSNMYYITKLLPSLEYISCKSLENIIICPMLFNDIFPKILLNESILIKIIDITCMTNNIISFNIIYNTIKNGNYIFVNERWINNNILLHALYYDSVDIVMELEKDNHNIKTIVITDTKSISSLVISLTSNTKKCFSYLLTKIGNINHSLLWSIKIPQYSSAWTQFFGFNKIITNEDNYDDTNDIIDNLDNIGEFTTINLAQLLNDDNNMDCWYVNDIIILLHYLINMSSNMLVLDQLEKIILIPNINIMKSITNVLFETIISVKSVTTKKYIRNRARIIKRNKKLQSRINNIIDIMSYYKIKYPQHIIYNPLEYNYNTNKNKKILKDVIKQLKSIGF